VAQDAVLIAMFVDLHAKTCLMEDMLRVAVHTTNFHTTPDALKADSAVKALALLEKESTVWHSAHSDSNPYELPGVSLPMAKAVHEEEHAEHVDGDDEQETVQDQPEYVDDVSLKTSFQFFFLMGELVIWIEAIIDKCEKNYEWI